MLLSSIDSNFARKSEFCAMTNTRSLNKLIEDAIVNNWYKDALTDYKGATLQYHDVARKIEKLHIMFESIGLQKGDFAVATAQCGHALSWPRSPMEPWPCLSSTNSPQLKSTTW